MSLEANGKGMRALSRGSLLLALLQSLCTAVLTISGIRVAIGLTALAAASGIYAPATGWHQDAIRIPMLIAATVGALVNLAVLFWIWHLRSRSSAQWRTPGVIEKGEALRAYPGRPCNLDADSGGAGNVDASHGSPHRAAAACRDRFPDEVNDFLPGPAGISASVSFPPFQYCQFTFTEPVPLVGTVY